jgi:hypothetical protein
MYYWVNFFGNEGDEWDLGGLETEDGVVIKPNLFAFGERYPALTKVKAKVLEQGRRVDVTFVEGFVPVVNERAKAFFERNCPGLFDAIYLQILGVEESYWLLNFYERINCLDFWKSNAKLFKSDCRKKEPLLCTGGERVLIMDRIGPSNVAFRPQGVAELVFHESLVKAIQAAELTGIWFEPVQLIDSGYTWNDEGWIPAIRRWWMRLSAW